MANAAAATLKAESERPRRVLHIEYADSLDVDDGLRIAIALSGRALGLA